MNAYEIVEECLQKDQQMLREVVDVLLMRSKYFTTTCFGIWLPSAGGRECLISYSSNFQALTTPEDGNHMPKHVGVKKFGTFY
jgi:hypothetical protein